MPHKTIVDWSIESYIRNGDAFNHIAFCFGLIFITDVGLKISDIFYKLDKKHSEHLEPPAPTGADGN